MGEVFGPAGAFAGKFVWFVFNLDFAPLLGVKSQFPHHGNTGPTSSGSPSAMIGAKSSHHLIKKDDPDELPAKAPLGSKTLPN